MHSKNINNNNNWSISNSYNVQSERGREERESEKNQTTRLETSVAVSVRWIKCFLAWCAMMRQQTTDESDFEWFARVCVCVFVSESPNDNATIHWIKSVVAPNAEYDFNKIPGRRSNVITTSTSLSLCIYMERAVLVYVCVALISVHRRLCGWRDSHIARLCTLYNIPLIGIEFLFLVSR